MSKGRHVADLTERTRQLAGNAGKCASGCVQLNSDQRSSSYCVGFFSWNLRTPSRSIVMLLKPNAYPSFPLKHQPTPLLSCFLPHICLITLFPLVSPMDRFGYTPHGLSFSLQHAHTREAGFGSDLSLWPFSQGSLFDGICALALQLQHLYIAHTHIDFLQYIQYK